MPPTGATDTLVINPAMNTTSNMAFTAGSAYQANGWIGGVLHPNGKIYCTPYSATNVLIIDPIAGTTNTTTLALAATASPGVAAYTTPAGWSGATLGPNGKIYCSPHLATSFLVIDPTAGTTSNLTVTNNTSPGAILAPNGNIYSIPRGSASTTLILTFSTLAQTPSYNYCLSPWTNRF
jgi:streptogramin lyase